MNRHTHRATLAVAALGAALVTASAGTASATTTTMASRYAEFQRQQAKKWALTMTVGSLTGALGLGKTVSTVTSTLDRVVRHKLRVTTGGINPTNTPMFGSDLEGRTARLDAQIGIAEAHASATGRDVVVAVLDSGFNVDHPAIAARVLPYGFDPVQRDWNPQDRGNGMDDDRDGACDAGVGHGTFVAGMVLAAAPDAWILPVRIADDEGYGLEEELISGIDFALAMGAHVLNLSYESGPLSLGIRDKLREAHARGVVVVVSAGNDASEETRTMAREGTTISVGAVDCGDAVAAFSNTPSDGEGLTLFAPGVDLFGPHGGPANDANCVWSGTSFSAPFAAGAAALVLETDRAMSPAMVRDRLRAASQTAVRAWDGTTYPHAGRLDLRRAVRP